MKVVKVSAPCRLHFGMFSFGHRDQPQFGGVGAMIEPPNVQLTITQASSFKVAGSGVERVREFVGRLCVAWSLPSLPACSIHVDTPSSHVGLGIGTQLGLSVAAALRRYLGLPARSIEQLATDVGRGNRSAVGTHGFQHGGLIVDRGKCEPSDLGTLARRMPIPDAWRFVLVRPTQARGFAGEEEIEKFKLLPAVPVATTDELWRLTEERMLPALADADCCAFGEAIYQFGRLAGECFAPAQGGPFRDASTEQLVGRIRDFGIAGVGQSSWGPTVFAITPEDGEADRLVNWLADHAEYRSFIVDVAPPNNGGARITIEGN